MSAGQGDSGGQDWMNFLRGVETLDGKRGPRKKQRSAPPPSKQHSSRGGGPRSHSARSPVAKPPEHRRAPAPSRQPAPNAVSQEVFDALERAQRRADRAETALKEAETALRELRQTEARAAQLERESAELSKRLDSQASQLERLRDRNIQQEAQLAALLDASRAAGTPLQEALRERGLKGRDEQARAIVRLLDDRRCDSWAERLTLSELDLPRMRQSLVLHCGSERCPCPSSFAAVTVARERCEICAGRPIDAVLKGLSSELMLHGFRRLHWPDLPPVALQVLSAALDQRVELILDSGVTCSDSSHSAMTLQVLRESGAGKAEGAQIVLEPRGSLMAELEALLRALHELS